MFGPVHAIVAHSMGGAAVTYAIHDYVDDPRGLPVKRLAFIAPPVDVRDFIRTFVHFIGGGPDLERALRARIEDRFGLQMEELYAPALARDLDAPLLVVHDENDREVPVDRGRLLASAWPGAKLEVTSGFGHTRILREQSVIDRIVDFVSES
jgi:pimeloyl-ACP methyl ester carboxylesterase